MKHYFKEYAGCLFVMVLSWGYIRGFYHLLEMIEVVC